MAFHWRIVHSSLGLFVFTTLACFPLSATKQSCIRKQDNFSSIPETRYGSNPHPTSGAILVLYHMVHTFLDMVQPNPFPTDLIKTFVNNNKEIEKNYQKILRYEVGFIVCAGIGLLFFILMPLVGIFFCCCRCCGNCGGAMYQEQTESINCKRKTLAAILFLVTTVMLAGSVCMFVSNEKTTESLQDNGTLLRIPSENLKIYLRAILTEVTAITNSSTVPINSVTGNLDNIGSNLGVAIREKLGETIYPALNSAFQLAQGIDETNKRLLLINSTAANLLHQQEVLEQNLTAIRQNINNIFNNCSSQCVNAQDLLKDLHLLTNFNMVPNMDTEIEALNRIANTNLSSIVQMGDKAFNDIPALLVNQSAGTVSEMKKSITDVKAQITNVTKDFPILTSINSVINMIDDITAKIDIYLPLVQQGDKYRWIVGIVLSCIILLVVLCNYLGLLLGAMCLKPDVDPTERSSLSNCGGSLFMVGVCFSFIFSWLLILLVFIMFIVGGNVYSLVCKPWVNDELFQVIETSGLTANVDLAQSLGLQNTSLNINSIYNHCQKNMSVWKVLHLSQTFNLDEHLNLNKYTGDISSEFDKLDVNFSGIVLLDKQGKQTVKDFLNTGVNDLNFTSISEQLRMPLFKKDLYVIAEKLQNNSKTAPEPFKTDLNNEAASLKELDGWIQSNMMPNIEILKENIKNLQANSSQIQVNGNATLSKVDSAQTFLHTKALGIIKNESKIFLDCQFDYLIAYVNWTKTMITENLARCRPVADAFDSVETIACSYFLDSLNAFWFSLGWSTIFFIPSIIFAVKLAKFYRRMKTSDLYDNGDSQFEMNPLQQ
ncbi:prominin-2 [Scyliorhinus canicula]|uniref:prominin-2 n=1 Tax=Scyliorhinus canicula TaxID=7830 RepID=UPI0018F5C0D2|nr:prominin-2 [Scyliorhinus canicula]XP_038677381.1 prominin-2 [Scyliorhinus canicula]XP_038677382.1 prominin-2 [Scyliorhinus canicula]XP_038677383.1 prominin-2 [Scyliorhinus canicula]XP_038677384.1 prominin-2 [Scyliorhinus canicula]XP_038677385.1 prominin-2 [Scyliorhinus canicula]XP_038677386.1 prominin-2 [Scyliorhinus canicula]